MPKPETKILRLQKALDLISAKDYESAELEIKSAIEEAEQKKDILSEGLLYSTLGLLFKLQKDFKTAWKHYEKAEKLLPDDPAIKLISARLLVEIFGQYDSALKKADKVLKIAPHEGVFAHQAHITKGLVYLKKGDKKKAQEELQLSMAHDFENLGSVGNIDFKLIEALLKKQTALEDCFAYLKKALAFAQKTEEKKYIQLIQRLIEGFPKEKNNSIL